MPSMSPSGLHLNKPVIAVLIGITVIGTVYFKMSGRTNPDVTQLAEQAPKQTEQKSAVQASKDSVTDLESVAVKHVKDLKVTVGDKNAVTSLRSCDVYSAADPDVGNFYPTRQRILPEVRVAYRETANDNPRLDVLFLHGMSFKSLTWVSKPVWTLQLLYKTGGYRAVAIDLPGYGNSPNADVDPAAFIEAVISKLKLNAPVIVSPSMSGQFALPYLFKDPANVLSRARGYVPVAPVSTEKYKPEQYKALKIPTLIIYGEKDTRIGAVAKKNLENLPEHKTVELAGAGHACYMDKPDEFHKYFLEFLNGLIK